MRDQDRPRIRDSRITNTAKERAVDFHLRLKQALDTADAMCSEELGRPADSEFRAFYLEHALAGKTAETIRGYVRANPEWVEKQKPAPPPPLIPAPTRLRVDGRVFRREDGSLFIYRGVTAFRLLEMVAHGREDEAVRFMTWARETGFNTVRVLCMADGLFKLSPDDGAHNLDRLLTVADTEGLWVEVVCLADTRALMPDATPLDFYHRLGALSQICETHSNTLWETANEPWHPTQAPDMPTDFAPDTEPAAKGAAQDDESDEYAGLDYVTVHLSRARDKWNQIRRVKELRDLSVNTGKPVVDDENIGAAEADEPGKRSADPAVFFTQGFLDRLIAGGTFHYSDGLQAVIPTGRQAECAAAYQQGSRIIPDDVFPEFKNAGWTDSPIKGADFDKVVRTYSAMNGDHGWTILLGISGNPKVEYQNGYHYISTLAEYPGVQVWEIGR